MPRQTPKKLNGKCVEIKIHLYNLEKCFLVLFRDNRIQLTRDPVQANASIRGPLKAFLKLAATKNLPSAIQLGLSFEGDMEVLETIQQFFFSLDIDWEEYISRWTGDIAAYQIGNFGRYLKKRQRALRENTAHSISEYLKEELRVLPTPTEVDKFMDSVDSLRADIDRLALRVRNLVK